MLCRKRMTVQKSQSCLGGKAMKGGEEEKATQAEYHKRHDSVFLFPDIVFFEGPVLTYKSFDI